MSNSIDLPARLSQTTLIAVHIDICRFTAIISEMDDGIKTVLFLDSFYGLCNEHIEALNGEVVKYMGDSCLAVFPADSATEAIEAVKRLRSAFPQLCESNRVKPTDIRAGIHVGEVIIGSFGPNGQRDVFGKAASLAIQASGTGITLSEQVYRKIPSADRKPWKKQAGQVVYCTP